MTTRSGATFKPMDQAQRQHGMAEETATNHTTTSQDSQELPTLTQMMQMMLEDRRLREAEMAEERRQWERENEERMRGMREQIQMLQQLITDRATTNPTRTMGDNETLRLTRLTEKDDVEAYLLTFERTMEAYEVNQARWTYKLAPQLTGKAQQAYAALSADEARDYATLKAAILRRYNINEETYRRQFRAARLKSEETPRELVTRLRDLAKKWGKDCRTMDDLFDLIIREQLLNCLPEDARVWVRERKPKTSDEAGELAEDFLQAHETKESEGRTKPKSERRSPPGKCPKCGLLGHWARDCPNPKTRDGSSPGEKPKRQERDQHCFICKERGHLSYTCPRNTGLYCEESTTDKGRADPDHSGGVYRSGSINGVLVRDMVLDTGASRTLVREDLVPPRALRDEKVTIRCAHGDTVTYPLADVKVSVGEKELCIQAAVSRTLPAPALLGRDVPELMTLLGAKAVQSTIEHPPLVLAVTTRAQTRQQRQEECHEHREPATEARATTISDSNQEVGSLPEEFDFHESLFSGGRERPRLSRSQKRLNKQQYTDNGAPQMDGAPHPLDLSAAELQRLQAEDSTLDAIRQAASGESSKAGQGFFYRDGLVYRRYIPPGCDPQDEELRAVVQLVLPSPCRGAVLRLAHSIPLAGHLGRNKTAHRILQRFYWPTVFRDVADYCRSCAECQKTSPRRAPRAPLMPLPIIDEPFSRIGMDIVGPLPRSHSGKKYILVICDYATRYPEAVALRSIHAECIAEELMKLFTRVGFPREILTDQGSNFTSQLLAELYRLLHIEPIKTSPYHPQTDGLVERFNQTLKAMLRRTATKEGKNWDKLIPYLLFAYREVPQASTGFSPFELLYGRQVRGPLDILRETWEASKRSSESVVSYVLSVQEKLAKLQDLVRDNLTNVQQTQKTWYDRHARDRHLNPGDQVLVLLPTSTNKLLAEWQGPYPIVRRIGRVVYEVEMKDRKRRKRRFHVNMLREWTTPIVSSLTAEEVNTEEDNADVIYWERTGEEPPIIGNALSPQQHGELNKALRDFKEVLCSRPGRTTIAEHTISTSSACPIRVAPYRIPHAYHKAVHEKLKEMEQASIIERSSSAWAAPIVPVRKKDGSMRLCVDYRRLNAVSQTDAYPMPRIDDLVDQCGGAHFITTLDLSRGYWQVPVREEDREKTAFITPNGLYQFRVMPFGLQGAPATFQRMMDSLLQGLESHTAAYLDDVVIHSTTWEDHLKHVRAVLGRLRDAGLTVKPKKCQFGMNSCNFLGHIVGGGQVRPDPAKLEAVKSFPQPTSKKQVRAFLGLAGYYRKFIPNFATIAAPLTDLTRKQCPNQVTWTDDCKQAFQTLRENLCVSPVLRSPDFEKGFVLQTDASDRGIGAVLSQTDIEDTDHPVAFYSRKFLPREEKYATVEKECLAIKLAIEAFKVYLLGRHFIIQTDHRALEWLTQLKDKNARLTRWSLILQQFDFTVTYRKGKANGNADGLSRAFVTPPTQVSQEKGGGVSGTQSAPNKGTKNVHHHD